MTSWLGWNAGWKRRQLLVLATIPVVHAGLGLRSAAAQRAAKKKKTVAETPVSSASKGLPKPLPQPVMEMREAILIAVESGKIEDLRNAIEFNEIKPDFDAPAGVDPIAFLKSKSADGQAYEILAALGLLLESPHAIVPGGPDIENNALYVWPAFAETGLAGLSPKAEVALYRLLRPAEVKAMRETKTWSWWRLTIGADGTWHSFTRADAKQP